VKPRRLKDRNLTDREGKARVVDCPRCGRPAGEPCVSGDLDLIRAHNERWDSYGTFVREAYCANEMLSGHPCSIPGCRSCGGLTAADLATLNTRLSCEPASLPTVDGPLPPPTV